MAFGRSKGSDQAVLGDDNDNAVPPPPAPDLFDPSVIEAADEDALVSAFAVPCRPA